MEVEEDATAIGLLAGQQSAASDSEDEEDVLVSDGEEIREVDESAFGRLMAIAVE